MPSLGSKGSNGTSQHFLLNLCRGLLQKAPSQLRELTGLTELQDVGERGTTEKWDG